MDDYCWSYIIGDIHGCYRELLALEDKIKQHARKHEAKPFIVSVGDLIDRGPDSDKVIAHFMQGGHHGTHTVVMGNHELLMIEALEIFAPDNFQQPGCTYPEWFLTYEQYFQMGKGMSRFLSWDDYTIMTKSLWLGQGGHSTLKSLGCDPHMPGTWKIPPQILSFLLHLPFYWEHKDCLVTHALAKSVDVATIKEVDHITHSRHPKPLSQEQIKAFQQAQHSLVWNRIPPQERPDSERLHVSGHTPVNTVRRLKKIHALQIDTACVYGKRLTAYCLETDSFLSVKAQRDYLN